ncbi:MAG: hypothetical protein RR150_09970, partial [Clostridia bacterium]
MFSAPVFALPQQVIDEVLADGGNGSNSKYLIAARMKKDSPIEHNADFLRREYQMGGKGFMLDGKRVSAWWDAEGIRIAYGNTVQTKDATLIPWKQAAKRVRELLNMGRYMPQAELDVTDHMERRDLARRLWNVYRDYFHTMPPEWDSHKGFPDDTALIAEQLTQPATQDAIIVRLQSDVEALDAEHTGRRFWDIAHRLQDDVSTLQRVPLMFTAANAQALPDDRRFITHDEIDAALRGGNPVHGGKGRIYRFFQTPHTDKERADFLKSEYGIGGRSHALSGADNSYEDYSGKGLTFSRGNMSQPYAKVTLNWIQAARRIGELVDMGRYLTPEEAEQIRQEGDMPKAIELEQLIAGAVADVEPEHETVSNAEALRLPAESEPSVIAASVPIGATLTLDGHEFKADSVNESFGRVHLQDITMFASGYPLFRDESIETVRNLLAQQPEKNLGPDVPTPEKADVVPNGTMTKPDPIASDGLRSVTIFPNPNEAPEVSPPADNYRIHDDHLGEGGQRAKADRNIEAIRALKGIEGEHRGATRDEQETLAQYVGWGGIPQIFDEANTDWQERREVLKALLAPDEYAAARASTLNAHYTSPIVIRAIYQGLENLGFRSGNILEPACGIGNFFGTVPESMVESKLYGVELDSITGRIAQKLYPNAKISVQGFEHSALPDGFFDAAVGNVPFGAYSLPDPKYDRHHFRIHDYFFAKALDKVRPGGVIAFVTSKGTMDKQDSSVRRYIAQRAELLGAIRLPNTAFKANAGTDVTTDILFLQKRDRVIEAEPDWLRVGQNADGVPVNQYYLDHPDMLMGTMAFDRSMYGNEQETTCNAIPGANLAEQLQNAIPNIRGRYEELSIDEPSPDESRVPADPTVPNFSFTVRDGCVYFRCDHWMERCDLNATEDKRVRGMIHLRDLTRELIQVQLSSASDEAIHNLQAELNTRYDSFTKQYGLLSDRRNASAFGEDDGYYLLTSLEVLDDEHKLERKADMFSKRTIAVSRPVEHVDTAPEALAVSMAERAKVDLDFMGELTGMGQNKIIADLTGLIYQAPYGNPGPYENWQTADEYLSGDVRQKLKQAQAAVEALGDQYKPNAEALQAVQPKDLEPHEIDVRLGATWIPPEDITAFTHELLKTPNYMRWKIKAHYTPITGAWNIENKGLDGNNAFANTQYGTDYRSGYKIIEESLNLRDVRVFDTIEDENGNEKRVLNQKQTILAQQKQTTIREAFRDWIWKEPRRRERLC